MTVTVENIIKEALNIPVLHEPSPLLPACATYLDYYMGAELSGDGGVQEWIGNYEVDLWYQDRTALDVAVKKLLSLIAPPVFSIPSAEKSCDPATKLWRAIIKFEKVEGDMIG